MREREEEGEVMDDSVIYTDVKFKRAPGEEATTTVGRAPIKPSEAQPRPHSKLIWFLGGAVLVLLITVVALATEIIRLHGERRTSSTQSQAGQLGRDLLCDRHLTEAPPTTIQRTSPMCPSDWVQHKDRCYLLSKQLLTRASALTSCSITCSQLAHTEDEDTLGFLRQHMHNRFYYWIGLNREQNDSKWVWMNGTSLKRLPYFNNTNHDDKDCATVSKDNIYAEKCEEKKGHICEKKANSQA